MAYAQDLMYPAGLEVLNFCLSLHLHICSVYASSHGSGVSVYLHRLISADVARQRDTYQERMHCSISSLCVFCVVFFFVFFFFFDHLHPLNNISIMRDGSSWVEPALS